MRWMRCQRFDSGVSDAKRLDSQKHECKTCQQADSNSRYGPLSVVVVRWQRFEQRRHTPDVSF
jgi:hypothetical protein